MSFNPKKQLEDLMSPILILGDQIRRLSLPVVSMVMQPEFVEKLSKLNEAMKRLQKFNESLNESHASDKILVPPFLGEESLPDFIDLFSNQEKTGLEIYDEFFSEQGNVRLLLEEWKDDSIFSPRIYILEKALQAHLNKDYVFSIPIFITQIEGIIRVALSYDKTTSDFKPRLRSMFPFKVRKEEDIDLFAFDPIADIICDDMFLGSDARNPHHSSRRYPNRNAILHGIDLDYYKDEMASTRCILILDQLRSEEFRLQFLS